MTKRETRALTVILEKPIYDALARKSYELSLKHNTRVTKAQIIKQGLLKLGLKPHHEKGSK